MKTATTLDDDGVYADTSEKLAASAGNQNVMSIPVSITVSVGTARLTIDELLSLKADSVLNLDAAIDDPVYLLIGERRIARGSLVETESNPPTLGVKITSVIDKDCAPT